MARKKLDSAVITFDSTRIAMKDKSTTPSTFPASREPRSGSARKWRSTRYSSQ